MTAALEADGDQVLASAAASGDVRHPNAGQVILDLVLHGESAGWP